MSTKALRRALDILEAHGRFDGRKDAVDAAAVAREELANIERAAKAFVTPIDTKTIITSREFVRLMQSIAKDAS